MRAAAADQRASGPGGQEPRRRRPARCGSFAEAIELVAFKHTVFALPFALMAMVTASGDGWPPPRIWFWVIVAMVAARTAAMSFNRLADHRFDAANPRTAGRSLPAGRLSRRFAWRLTAGSTLVFVAAAAALNRLCLALAVPTLVVLLGYSYGKRLTPAVHLWLGAALGIAPVGAWIAVTGAFAEPPLVLGAAVMCWVAGFDIIYSLQDESFDRANQLRSLPADLGARRALIVARSCHLIAIAGFMAFAVAAGGGWLRFTAVVAAGALMLWQHRLVGAGDLGRVNAAFFTANGFLSISMCGLFVAAKIVG